MAHGEKVHWVGEVAQVSKTHVFSMNWLPLIRTVWLYGDNHSICPLSCSNYNKKYYRCRFWVPTDNSSDPEDIHMVLRIPEPCQPEVCHMVS